MSLRPTNAPDSQSPAAPIRPGNTEAIEGGVRAVCVPEAPARTDATGAEPLTPASGDVATGNRNDPAAAFPLPQASAPRGVSVADRDADSDAPSLETEAPFSELMPTDPQLLEQAKDAIRQLPGQGRLTNGRAGPRNTIAMKPGGIHSRQLLDVREVAAWHRAEADAIIGELGGPSELSRLEQTGAREAARLVMILGSLGEGLLQHGVLTGKGRTRAATNTYLKVLREFTSLADKLGWKRRAKSLNIAERLARLHDEEPTS